MLKGRGMALCQRAYEGYGMALYQKDMLKGRGMALCQRAYEGYGIALYQKDIC